MKNREGSFKEKLVDLNILAGEATILHPLFQEIKSSLSQRHITEAEFVALYLLIYQFVRTPKNSLQGVAKKLTEKNIETSLDNFLKDQNLNLVLEFLKKSDHQDFLKLSLLEIFSLNFKGIPKKMNLAISNWLKQKWPLKLFFHIPNANDLLSMQKKGSRCVTTPISHKSLSSHVLGKRDSLSFVIHDLEHAVNFYSEDQLMAGQIGFYSFVDELLNTTWMKELISKNQNQIFHHHLDYVIADMNAYSVHLVKYLYGILIKYGEDSALEHHWNKFIINLNALPQIQATLTNINSPELCDINIEELHSWFVARGFQSLQKE